MSSSVFVGPDDDPERYELTELRGRGGEGELWGGWVTVSGQQLPVAVKILIPPVGASIDELLQRLQTQAELLRSLEHPNLVKVREAFAAAAPHGAGSSDPSSRCLVLTMNWAQGENLESWVARNPQRDPLACTRIISRLSAAVEELNSGRSTGGIPVLHRDIKPANVVVENDDVKLVDFGLAKLMSDDQMTIVGSVNYVPPEVLAGAPASEASDRFGVGATAFFLLVGAAPNINDPASMRSQLLQVSGIADRDGFADHVMSMVDRDPARRPSNLIEWSQALAVGTVSQTFATGATAPLANSPLSDSTLNPSLQVTPGASSPRKGRKGLAAATAVILLGIAGVAGFILTRGGDDSGGDFASSPTTTEETTTTTSTTTTSTTSTTTTTTTTTSSTVPPENPSDIAAPEGVQYLADFNSVDSDSQYSIGTGIAAVSGTSYTRSISLYPGYSDPGFVEYDLGRKYASFETTVGLRDDVKSGTRMVVQIYGDGRELLNRTVGLGEAIPATIDVSNVLRLRLQTTLLTEDGGYSVFGDARLNPAG